LLLFDPFWLLFELLLLLLLELLAEVELLLLELLTEVELLLLELSAEVELLLELSTDVELLCEELFVLAYKLTRSLFQGWRLMLRGVARAEETSKRIAAKRTESIFSKGGFNGI